MKYLIEIELSPIQIAILQEMREDCEYCIGYNQLDKIADKKTLQKEMRLLREIGFVEYHRGLMTDEGDVAGSGFCRSYEGNKFLDKYEL